MTTSKQSTSRKQRILDSVGRWVLPLLVRITAADIQHGMKDSSVGCMVNRAVKRAFKRAEIHARRVRTDEHTIDATADGVRRRILTPDVARRALIDFDAGLPVAPFKFRLDPTQAVVTPVNTRDTTVREHRRRAVSEVATATGGIPDVRAASNRPHRRTRADRRYGARALYINQIRPVEEILDRQIAMGKAAAAVRSEQEERNA